MVLSYLNPLQLISDGFSEGAGWLHSTQRQYGSRHPGALVCKVVAAEGVRAPVTASHRTESFIQFL
jgi:hypothetical protein